MSIDNENTDSFPCPYCRELITAGSPRCRYCGAGLARAARPGWVAAEEQVRKSDSSSAYIVLIVFLGLVVLLAAMMITGYQSNQRRGRLTYCKSNLKNIGTALEMYSTDNMGHYPVALSALTPNYLHHIPTCPAAGSNTYRYTSASAPDAYTVYCRGNNHSISGIGPDQPSYNSITGLEEAPRSTP